MTERDKLEIMAALMTALDANRIVIAMGCTVMNAALEHQKMMAEADRRAREMEFERQRFEALVKTP